jgi:hypothetical protein
VSQRNWSSKPLLLAKLASLVGASLLFAIAAFAQGKPEKLECESLVTPLGADTKQPVLSWQLRDTRFGAKQTVKPTFGIAAECNPATRSELRTREKRCNQAHAISGE